MNFTGQVLKKLPAKRCKMDSESEEDKSPESKLKPQLQVLDDEESIPERSIQQRATKEDDITSFIKEDDITSFIQIQENMLFQDAMPSVKTNILVTNINSSLVDL